MMSREMCNYEDVRTDVAAELSQTLCTANRLLPRWLQFVDPGVGFAKSAEDCMTLLHPAALQRMKKKLGDRVLMIGASRKRFLDTAKSMKSLSVVPVEVSLRDVKDINSARTVAVDDRDWATAAANCAAIAGGADIIRVHNVRAARLTCDVMQKILASDGPRV